MKRTDVFISYSRHDADWIDRAKPAFRRLKNQLNVAYFQDVESICPGEDWEGEISTALKQASVVVCFLSDRFYASEFIQKKELPLIERALDTGNTVLCVPVTRVFQPDGHFLSRVQWITPPSSPIRQMSEAEFSEFMVTFEKVLHQTISRLQAGSPIAPKTTARYNIVIVGKTGVGKTQLVNYLLGEQRLSSAVGLPETLEGFHGHNLDISGIPTTVYDSAGLEVGEHEKWIRSLRAELSKRGLTEPVNKWFHTVLYCVSASGGRFEPFEASIIKEFLDQCYTVIVVLTKAYVDDGDLDAMTRTISKNTPKDLACVRVNSTVRKLAGGMSVPSYGRAELTREIQVALFDSVTDRVPLRCIRFMEKYLDEKCSEVVQYVRQQTASLGKKAVAENVEDRMQKLSEDVSSPHGHFCRLVRRETVLALETYSQIGGLFAGALAEGDERDLVPQTHAPKRLPRVERFWPRVESALDDFYDSWDIEDEWGEVVDIGAKILAFPVAIVYSFFDSARKFIKEHLEWEEEAAIRIREHVNKLKDVVKQSEAHVRRYLTDSVRSM